MKHNEELVRVHIDCPYAVTELTNELFNLLEPQLDRDLVVVCIGTDRSTGDSFGPLVGTFLERVRLRQLHVYGTLAAPIHATNLQKKLTEIKDKHPHSYMIAVDACLGHSKHIGSLKLATGPVHPGTALKKKLPEVGHSHLIGIVNIGGMMDYYVLQSTRLHTVMEMAKRVSSSFIRADLQLSNYQASINASSISFNA